VASEGPVTSDFFFQRALGQNPDDTSLRLVFADFLEERGDLRGELIRLMHTLTQSIDVPGRQELETRLRGLLQQGVRPVGPFWTNSIGMKFAWVPPGTFLMGSPENEVHREPDETQHEVTLTEGFYMGVHLVTREQWLEMMWPPSQFKEGKNLPVQGVSWEDCQEFCRRLKARTNGPYRLPTEAEWEFACRGGTTTPFFFGEFISTDEANYDGNYMYVRSWDQGVFRGRPMPVGTFPANAWGLCDTHGNLWEWVGDWYGAYPRSPVVDPKGPDTGETHVARGGSWQTGPAACRSAARYAEASFVGQETGGFRVCFGGA
jgi:uncharacterized protein (TIGR02996 family)